ESVKLVQGDTDVIPVGGGSHSGRSMRMAGVCMGSAATAVLERSKRIAAHMLKVEPKDVAFEKGSFSTAGSGRKIGVVESACAAHECDVLDDALRGPLAAQHDPAFTDGGYPYGTAVCEVEIDRDTGAVDLVRYSAIDDVGRAVNPMILHGQTHGGIAQGVG